MGINKRDEGKKVNSNINVTPMVDVMLVLLIIFMVITPMLNNKVNVDLPKADAAKVMENANKEDAIVVAVTRDGKTYLGANQVTVDNLGGKISTLIENKTDKPVSLRPYALILRRGTPKVAGYSVLHEGFVGVIGDGSVQEVTYAGIEKEAGKVKEKVGKVEEKVEEVIDKAKDTLHPKK